MFQKKHFFLFIFFILLTILIYRVDIGKLTTHLIGRGDAWQNVWNIWWFRFSIFKLKTSPYFCSYLHYPYGISLIFHTLGPLNCIISLPFYFLTENIILTYNIVLLINFGLCGLITFILIKAIFKDDLITFFCSFLFTFSPYHSARAIGHLNFVTLQYLALTVFALYLLYKSPSISGVILLSVSLLCNAFSCFHYLLHALIIVGIYFMIIIVLAIRQRLVKLLIFSLTGIILFFVIYSPFLIKAFNELKKVKFDYQEVFSKHFVDKRG